MAPCGLSRAGRVFQRWDKHGKKGRGHEGSKDPTSWTRVTIWSALYAEDLAHIVLLPSQRDCLPHGSASLLIHCAYPPLAPHDPGQLTYIALQTRIISTPLKEFNDQVDYCSERPSPATMGKQPE